MVGSPGSFRPNFLEAAVGKRIVSPSTHNGNLTTHHDARNPSSRDFRQHFPSAEAFRHRHSFRMLLQVFIFSLSPAPEIVAIPSSPQPPRSWRSPRPSVIILFFPPAPEIVAITETLCHYRVLLAVPQLCQLPKFFPGSIFDMPAYSDGAPRDSGAGGTGGTGGDPRDSGAGGATYIECSHGPDLRP